MNRPTLKSAMRINTPSAIRVLSRVLVIGAPGQTGSPGRTTAGATGLKMPPSPKARYPPRIMRPITIQRLKPNLRCCVVVTLFLLYPRRPVRRRLNFCDRVQCDAVDDVVRDWETRHDQENGEQWPSGKRFVQQQSGDERDDDHAQGERPNLR